MVICYLIEKFIESHTYQAYIVNKIKQNPKYMDFIKNPSYDILFNIIDINPEYVFKFLHLITAKHLKHALSKDPRIMKLFQYYPGMSDEIKKAALEVDYTNIFYMDNNSYDILKKAISINPNAIKLIRDVIPEDLLEQCIIKQPDLIYMLKNPSEKLISLAKTLGMDMNFWEID